MNNDRKPDFSQVQGGASSLPADPGGKAGLQGGRPDGSNLAGGADSVPAGQGGAGSLGARTYTIERGDTLSAIAQRVYGKASYWQQIFQANRDRLDNPDRIVPGQVIALPEIEEDGEGRAPPPSAA